MLSHATNQEITSCLHLSTSGIYSHHIKHLHASYQVSVVTHIHNTPHFYVHTYYISASAHHTSITLNIFVSRHACFAKKRIVKSLHEIYYIIISRFPSWNISVTSRKSYLITSRRKHTYLDIYIIIKYIILKHWSEFINMYLYVTNRYMQDWQLHAIFACY